MRKIITADVFKLSRIIKTANVKETIANLVTEGKKKNADEEAIGIEAIMTVMESCSSEKLEKQMYELIAGITEKKPEEIENQSLEATITDVKQIVKENNISLFFKQASQLTK